MHALQLFLDHPGNNCLLVITKAAKIVAILLFAFLANDCGGGAPNESPNVPWAGSVGSVLIGETNNDSDHVPDQLWVGFNNVNMWQKFKDLRSSHGNDGSFWIGGHVVVSATSSLGFYFDPGTTVVGEITAEGQQTTLDFIKADPATFANTGFGKPTIIWYVPAFIEKVSGN